MRLKILFFAIGITAALVSCANDDSTNPTWTEGIWQSIETDFDEDVGGLIQFTRDGRSYLYDRSCNRVKDIEFLVRNGNIYVGSRNSENKFPPAIFYPSDGHTKLTWKSPGSDMTVTYGKTSMSECPKQG